MTGFLKATYGKGDLLCVSQRQLIKMGQLACQIQHVYRVQAFMYSHQNQNQGRGKTSNHTGQKMNMSW